MPTRVLLATLALLLTHCTDDASGPGAGPDAATSPDAAPLPPDAALPDPEVPVPSNADDLFAYLQARGYTGFAAETGAHRSAGPHSGTVRTFVNPTLAASLSAGGAHPVGAAAVKELNTDGQLSGWAVSVKLTDGEDGTDWYWYEVFNTTTGNGAIQGVGNAICTGCHSAGDDYFMSTFPLQ